MIDRIAVVRGEPDAEELAALLTVLAVAGGPAAASTGGQPYRRPWRYPAGQAVTFGRSWR